MRTYEWIGWYWAPVHEPASGCNTVRLMSPARLTGPSVKPATHLATRPRGKLVAHDRAISLGDGAEIHGVAASSARTSRGDRTQ